MNLQIRIGTVSTPQTGALPVYLRELDEDCGPTIQVGDDPGDGDLYAGLEAFMDDWRAHFAAGSTTITASAFTVIGYYEDTGETFADHVEAEDEHGAMAIVAKQRQGSSEVAVVGALPGRHSFTPPSDCGNLAYACDLVAEGEQA